MGSRMEIGLLDDTGLKMTENLLFRAEPESIIGSVHLGPQDPTKGQMRNGPLGKAGVR